MITTYLYASLSILIVSLISFVGVVLLSLKEGFIKKYIFIFVSLAVGALLGDAFIHLIPEIFEADQNIVFSSILIILGILIFFIVEKFFHWHHHGEDESSPHVKPVGNLVLFSDAIHNLIDGIIIGASFVVSIPLGIATTIAVVLHEIPQEIGDFAVLIHSGYSRKKALWLNFLSALSAFLGLILVIILQGSSDAFVAWALPIATGGFIYIAVADLIPELHKTKEVKYSVLQIISVAIGVLLMFLLLFIE